jgi:hypothetical protein
MRRFTAAPHARRRLWSELCCAPDVHIASEDFCNGDPRGLQVVLNA